MSPRPAGLMSSARSCCSCPLPKRQQERLELFFNISSVFRFPGGIGQKPKAQSGRIFPLTGRIFPQTGAISITARGSRSLSKHIVNLQLDKHPKLRSTAQFVIEGHARTGRSGKSVICILHGKTTNDHLQPTWVCLCVGLH